MHVCQALEIPNKPYPICQQPVERLLALRVNNGPKESIISGCVLREMGPGRVECVGPRLTKLRGQYYIRLVFFANREGASGTYDEAKEVQNVPIFAMKGEGFKKFNGGAEEIWVCWLTKANLDAMVPQIDD
ncbi:hypothetical protein EV2_023962 [Malus domestica]